MGALAEAARPLMTGDECACAAALKEKVVDAEDQAVIDALVEKRRWTVLSRLLGTSTRLTARHFMKEGCACG